MVEVGHMATALEAEVGSSHSLPRVVVVVVEMAAAAAAAVVVAAAAVAVAAVVAAVVEMEMAVAS